MTLKTENNILIVVAMIFATLLFSAQRERGQLKIAVGAMIEFIAIFQATKNSVSLSCRREINANLIRLGDHHLAKTYSKATQL